MISASSVSVIIPTKDRPESLEHAVQLLLGQTACPNQVVIIDQGRGYESRDRVESLFRRSGTTLPQLAYIHAPEIPGAAVARNRGMELATGGIWLFLDDDMEPEAEFVERLLEVYASDATVSGVSGIISNYARPSLAFRVWASLFLRGPFHDERQPIYWRADELRNSGPIRVAHFGSGLMSFRADVVREVRFDASLRGLPPGEDLDFCARLDPSVKLVIAPRARIAHRQAEAGRTREYWIKEYAQGKLYNYHRNWGRGPRDRLALVWFQCGCALVAVLGCVRRGSLGPWQALRRGIREAGKHASAEAVSAR